MANHLPSPRLQFFIQGKVLHHPLNQVEHSDSPGLLSLWVRTDLLSQPLASTEFFSVLRPNTSHLTLSTPLVRQAPGCSKTAEYNGKSPYFCLWVTLFVILTPPPVVCAFMGKLLNLHGLVSLRQSGHNDASVVEKDPRKHPTSQS